MGAEGSAHPSVAQRLWSATGRALPVLLGAAVLRWFGADTGAIVAACAATMLVVVGVATPWAAEELDSLTGRLANATARALGSAISAMAWAIVVLPVWALSRLVGHSPLDSGWGGTASAWITVEHSRGRTPDYRPVSPDRLGARDLRAAPNVRRRASLRMVIVATAGVLALVGWYIMDEGGEPPSAGIDLRGTTLPAMPDSRTPVTVGPDDGGEVTWNGYPLTDYAHEGEPWARQHFRELNAGINTYDLILGARGRDFKGSTLNINDGRRATYTPADPQLTVWYFGGSTMFGIGQRDDHTIPSVIAKLAESDGIRLRGLNFGISGDVNWQETIRFAEALHTELPRPDLVVFYDGANEKGIASYRADNGYIDPDVSVRFPISDSERDTLLRAFGTTEPLPWGPDRDEVETELAASQYRRGVEVARTLAAAEGIPIVHVWQPQPFAKKASPADEELYRRLDFDPVYLPQTTRIYQAIKDRSGVSPMDLTTALDDVDVPVYFDASHTNELGARVVATELYERIKPKLTDARTGS